MSLSSHSLWPCGQAEAASLFAPLASLHAARLRCLLAPLAAHAAASPLPRHDAAEGAAEGLCALSAAANGVSSRLWL